MEGVYINREQGYRYAVGFLVWAWGVLWDVCIGVLVGFCGLRVVDCCYCCVVMLSGL